MENYEKIKKLGKGSFGNVHLVMDKRTNQHFALKKVQFEINIAKVNPINEVKLMSSLEHCNIIKCYGYFTNKEKLCIIMEYADDGDLLRLVMEAKKTITPISEKMILTWFTQICLALKYLHDKNILHRDIKIQNIFLMKTGLIKLGDFGISKKLENSQDLAQTSLGTPYYLSPELCSAIPYGKKTDIWMLGCLLYELCSLERPFSGENISVLMNKILKEEPRAIPSVYSPFIQKLVGSLLMKNHLNRPDIEEILAYKEIHLEIRNLILKFPNYYKSYEDIYCKDLDFLIPKHAEFKKKSLIKPLSYSTLPNLNQESPEKLFTPHNQKNLEKNEKNEKFEKSEKSEKKDKNDKNSIFDVIKQAKKQTFFSGFDSKKQDDYEIMINSNPDHLKEEILSPNKNYRVSFEQYLTNKLTTEKNDDNNNINKKIPSKKDIFNNNDEISIKKTTSHKLEIGGANRKLPANLDIIEERTPVGGSAKLYIFDEEEKKINFNGKNISPTNFAKFKKNSPKGAIIEKLIGSTEGSGVPSQRSRLFVEFLKERLGEEKFQKVKGILQDDNGPGVIDRKRNEILEIIGIKNAEVLKYLGVLCNDGGEKRKATYEVAEPKEKEEGNRQERTSSGYGKMEGLHKK